MNPRTFLELVTTTYPDVFRSGSRVGRIQVVPMLHPHTSMLMYGDENVFLGRWTVISVSHSETRWDRFVNWCFGKPLPVPAFYHHDGRLMFAWKHSQGMVVTTIAVDGFTTVTCQGCTVAAVRPMPGKPDDYEIVFAPGYDWGESGRFRR